MCICKKLLFVCSCNAGPPQNKPPLQSSTVPPPSPPPRTKKKKMLIHQLLHLHTITAPFKAECRRKRWSPLCLLTLLLPARLFIPPLPPSSLSCMLHPRPSPPSSRDCSPFSCDRRGLGVKRDARAHPSYSWDAKRPSLGARLEPICRAFSGGRLQTETVCCPRAALQSLIAALLFPPLPVCTYRHKQMRDGS